MNKQYINPAELYNSTQFGYSQATVSNPGKLVFISAQFPCNEDQHLVGGADIISQARQAFDNLKIAIEKSGGSLKDIVMLKLYMVDYREEDADAVGSIMKEYFGTDNPPASTWIGVKSLVNYKFLIGIEAQAVIN
jgi:2-iminobutanoate/2-iminopropanoate deaminase